MKVALVALFVMLIAGASFAVTDCELCQLINEIYGACSPELVANYANHTNQTVEWLCLQGTPFVPGNNSQEITPIKTIAAMRRRITLYEETSAVVIVPSCDFDRWNFVKDGNKMNWSVECAVSTKPTEASFKIYSVMPLVRNGSTITANRNLFVNFSHPISNAAATPYGYEVKMLLSSLSPGITKLNISGQFGYLSTCAIICVNPVDEVFVGALLTNSTNRPISGFIDLYQHVWTDALASCTITSDCYLIGTSDDTIGLHVIPPTNYSLVIDANGTTGGIATRNPTKTTWYYFYKKIQCHNPGSGLIKAVLSDRGSAGGIGSATSAFSCVSSNTPPGVYLSSPANNSNITSPSNFTFYFVDPQNATANCSLWINGTRWYTNTSVLNNTNTSFLVPFNYTGNYTWFVNCSDGLLTNVSATWNTRVWLNNPFGWGLGLSLIALILAVLSKAASNPILKFALISIALIVIIGTSANTAWQAVAEGHVTVEAILWSFNLLLELIFGLLWVVYFLELLYHANTNALHPTG